MLEVGLALGPALFLFSDFSFVMRYTQANRIHGANFSDALRTRQ